MKNILVPTDFSACAANAVDAAFKLAKKAESTVHLLHIITDKRTQNDEQEWNQAIENANVLLKKIRAEHSDVECKALSDAGK